MKILPNRLSRLRVALLALIIIVAIQVLAVTAVSVRRAQDTEGDFRFPLPDQAVAIVELVEAAPPERLSAVRRAVNSPDVRVAVLDADPLQGDAPRASLPAVERVIRRYSDALEDRKIAAYIAQGEGELSANLRLRDRGLWSDLPLRLDIELADGRILQLETRGDLSRKVFGWPLGLGAGVFGLLVAAAAAWSVWRESKPILGLATRLERFADAVDPVPAPEKGPVEIRTLIAAFNRLQTRVATLLEARNTMLGAVSHDLRTFLTRLRLRTDLIADEVQRDKAEAALDAMDRIIGSALALARSEAGSLEKTRFDLREMLDAFADGAPSSEATRVMRVPEAPVMIDGDRAALARVFANLVENAQKYAGACEIVVSARDGFASVDVLDRGAGLPEAELERLTQPFERGDRARGQGVSGSGLGLAIARNISEAHGGHFPLENRTGGGLAARVSLPLASE
ncbi:MAG: sensor histidine kinase [Neomegalonema sp.]